MFNLTMRQRRDEVLKIINEKENISVDSLISMFDVSPSTLRKDLAFLEEQNKILRTRGEAHKIYQKDIVIPFKSRSMLNDQEKKKIAKVAIDLLDINDTILLDSGSTTWGIAQLLIDFSNITILTNSIPIAILLADSNCYVNLAGGYLFKENISTQGPETEEYINKFETQKAFIGASGVNLNSGLAASTPFEKKIKKCMINSADTVYAVLDHTKFQKRSLYVFADFEDIDYIITDKRITDRDLQKKLTDANVEVIVAE